MLRFFLTIRIEFLVYSFLSLEYKNPNKKHMIGFNNNNWMRGHCSAIKDVVIVFHIQTKYFNK